MSRPSALVVLAPVLALTLAFFLTRGPGPASIDPPGSFSFGALGDSPYYLWEELQYRVVLQDMAAHELHSVVHIGDLFWTACTDERYEKSLDDFAEFRHPLVYTPGDNEWADCWSHEADVSPLSRLGRLRELFFPDPSASLGARSLDLDSQGDQEPFTEYVENARWTHEGVVFATIHLVGSGNATASFEGRRSSDDEASIRRTEAAAAWLRDAFAEAAAIDARAVVIAFHANLRLEEPLDDPSRKVFEPFIATLEEEVALFGLPVLIVHGDWHDYTVDRPLTDRATGQPLDNLVRLQVPGSPHVGWVRVTVTEDRFDPFRFEPRVIPRWKYW